MILGEGELTTHYREGPGTPIECGAEHGCVTSVVADVGCQDCHNALSETSTADPGFRHPVEGRHPIAETLKGRRLALGLNQREVVARMGSQNQAVVSAWETGKYQPTLVNLDLWARALGCEVIVVEAEGEAESP